MTAGEAVPTPAPRRRARLKRLGRAGARAALLATAGAVLAPGFLISALTSAPGFAEEARPPGVAAPVWPDTFLGRLEVLALMETLNAALLSGDSATLTLETWCDRHGMARPARIVADRVRGTDKPPTEEVRRRLGIGADAAVGYRRVRLRCGAQVLSEADNWYVPSRLTAEMNSVLDTTDTPFGRAVRALDFRRRTLSARLLWRPLPEGWETGAPLPADGAGPLAIPSRLIEHQAVLSLPDGTPFSLVVETYTDSVLAFPRRPVP